MKKRTPKMKQVKRSLSMIIALALVFSMLLAVPVGATEANTSPSADAAADSAEVETTNTTGTEAAMADTTEATAADNTEVAAIDSGVAAIDDDTSDVEEDAETSVVISYEATIENNQVALKVSIADNPGMLALMFSLNVFNADDFSYVSSAGGLCGDGDIQVMPTGSGVYTVMVQASSAIISGDGDLFTMYFSTKEGIDDGEYAFQSTSGTFMSSSTSISLEDQYIPFAIGDVDPAQSITLSESNLSVHTNIGATGEKAATLQAIIEPSGNYNRFVQWVSADTSIATVSSKEGATCTVYGEKDGTTQITATTANGLSASCTVTVSTAVTDLTITGSLDNRALFVGDTDNLALTLSPSNATNKNTTWKSSNEGIVTVTQGDDSGSTKTGEIIAVAPGTATVTVSTTDGSDLSVSVTYRVYEKPDETASAASVGDKDYPTLQDAINAATKGDTVTLLRDVYEDKINVESDLGISLDLAGHTLVTDTFTIKQGASMEKISGGTITQMEYTAFDTDRYIYQKFQQIENNVGLSVDGSLNILDDCQIAGYLYCGDPDGFIDQISNCTLDGDMVIAGQADNIIGCQVTGCIAVSFGTTSSEDPSIGVGHIGGLYECNVTGIVLGYDDGAPYQVDSTSLNIFSGSYYNPSDYAVYAWNPSLTTLYGGRYGSAKQTGNILDENNVIGSNVKYAMGYSLSETPDADGYYEIVEGNQRSRVIFSLSPEEAIVTVTDEDGNEVQPEEDNALTYVLQTKKDYTYTVTCDGYETIVGHCVLSGMEDPLTIPITMEQSQDKNYVTGGDVVLSGGEYYLSDERKGIVTIMTTEPVTIVGDGIGGDNDTTGRMEEMTLDCTMSGTHLTIQDLWINDDNGQGTSSGSTNFGMNLVNFSGKDNVLTFKGDNLIEAQEYVQGAAIHVGKGDGLTIEGYDDSSNLYFYKYTQGSGIGGNANESCGEITFASGNIFIKGSKTGSCIGGDDMTGATTNDDIRINKDVNMMIVTVGQGSAIGSSRLGKCAGNVYLDGGNLTIVSDFTGDAIGDGGNLYVNGGSFKPVRTGNSLNGDSDSNTQVVDDSLVTAAKLGIDSGAETGYSDAALLTFDTSQLASSSSMESGKEEFTVTTNMGFNYTGGLHHYKYTEVFGNSSYTPDNFTYTDDDKNLYLYLPKKDQTLTVNGEEFLVTYSEGDESTGEKAGFKTTPTINGWAIDIADCAYDGTPQKPSVTVTAGDGTALTEGEDYAITWPEDMTSAGEKTLTITPLGKYEGEGDRTVTFTIAPKDVSDLSVTLPDGSFPYTGQAREPDVTVTMGGTTLVKDTDYTVVYANNTAVGTATVTVTGIGNYTGTATKTFEITKAEMPTPVINYDENTETLTAGADGTYKITWDSSTYITEMKAGEPFSVLPGWIGQEITIVRVSDDAANCDDSAPITISIGASTGVTEPGPANISGADTLCVRRGQIYYFSYSIHAGEADLVTAYGTASDTVLFGDWDGDGIDTYCVRRGAEYYFRNSLTSGDADEVIVYGRPDDEVLVGDWDGDGSDTLAVRRGRTYYLSNSIKSGNADQEIVYGRETDDVIVGDWDGDNKDTPAVRRGATYYFQNSFTGGTAEYEVVYGHADDVVLVGDWDGDGKDTLAVRRGAEYYFKNSISAGEADEVVVYGRADDEVYAGRWQ